MPRKQRVLNVRGNYKVATDWMRSRQVYTKQDLISFYMYELGKDEKAAKGSAIVLLSPRLKSKHGDPRGSMSNPWGHIAYNEMLVRRVDPKTGIKEKQRYCFRFRDVPLEKKRHSYYQRKSDQEKEMTADNTVTGKSGKVSKASVTVKTAKGKSKVKA
jgi:hypothetical protein